MEANEATLLKIERFFNKVAQKFPKVEEPTIMSDIHLCLSQESGELLAFDDDDNEITRCVLDQWINNQDTNFYDCASLIFRKQLEKQAAIIEKMGILRPYSFILENEEREHVAELSLVDNDIKIIGGDLMNGLGEDVDNFFKELMK